MDNNQEIAKLFQDIYDIWASKASVKTTPSAESDIYRITMKDQLLAEKATAELIGNKNFLPLTFLNIGKDVYAVGGNAKKQLEATLKNRKMEINNLVAGLSVKKIMFLGPNNDLRKLQVNLKDGKQTDELVRRLKTINGATKVVPSRKAAAITGLAEIALRNMINQTAENKKRQQKNLEQMPAIKQFVKRLLTNVADEVRTSETGTFLVIMKKDANIDQAKKVLIQNNFELAGRLKNPGTKSFSIVPNFPFIIPAPSVEIQSEVAEEKVSNSDPLNDIIDAVERIKQQRAEELIAMETTIEERVKAALEARTKGFLIIRIPEDRKIKISGIEIPVELFPTEEI